MDTIQKYDTHGNGLEPSMYDQRPSSGRCQDISHVLNRIFRDEFTKDAVDQETVRNLTTSKSGKPGYHDRYVESLQQIQQQWEKRMEEANMTERHLEEARELARENEVKLETKASEDVANYRDLGLPAVRSHLTTHLNSNLLRRLNLIVPQDFIKEARHEEIRTYGEVTPQYARPTTSSMQRYRRTPVEDNYYLEDALGVKIESKKQVINQEADILTIDRLTPDTGSRARSKGKDFTRKAKLANGGDEKNMWREVMKPAQRQEERKELAKLQQKADYLKNPRFIPPKTIKTSVFAEKATNEDLSSSTKRCDPRDVFQPIPDPVVFTDYEPGKVYEIVLTLKNTTSSSRQLRVLPPSSPYFAIGLGKFPTSDGQVAPGMNCQYSVKFAPDSLADYDDVIKVETQFTDPLLLPLQGRRPPPNLILSDTFNCGYCLVGGNKLLEFNCENVGGEGRFFIIPKDKWRNKSLKAMEKDNIEVSVGPFIIQPSKFHLKPNEKVNIMVSFSPKAVKRCREEIVMVCDNCNIKEFILEGFGETASVEFVTVESGLSNYALGESKDKGAEYLVTFEKQHPGTVCTKKLDIRNITAVELKYDWIIDRPVYQNPTEHGHLPEAQRFTSDKVAFEISPSSGIFTPMGVSSFSLSFKPAELSTYNNVARLVLRKVPESSSIVSETCDLVTIQIALKGCTKPFEVNVQPEVLILDGSVEINHPREIGFIMSNHSDVPVPISWPKLEDDECCIQFEPDSGYIGPKEDLKCYLVYVGKKAGFKRRTCQCDISFTSAPVYCHFEAFFTGPVLRFVDSVLDFGLVQHCRDQCRLVEIKNFSSIEAIWNLNDEYVLDRIKIEPTNGTIESFGTQLIKVYLNADDVCMLSEIIDIHVETGDHCYLETRAIIERPEARLLESHLSIDECYVNVPLSKTVVLQNLTLFSVEFSWEKVVGKDSKICSLDFKTASGTMKPRERMEVEVDLCFKNQGKINELLAICHIKGMLEPVLLSVNADVQGLMIDFNTPDVRGEQRSLESSKELKLEFGYDVPMFLNPKAVLVLKNQSAITTSFSLSIEYFHAARVPTPPEQKRKDKQDTKRTRPLLMKTPNIADPLSKTPTIAFRDYCLAVLADGKGAAFVPTPSAGHIGPFEQIIIEVTAFVDMWGEYNDNIICMIDGLDPVKIPIHLETVGCPLNFQMSKDPQPILRFGSHISGGETCTRSLRINNPSPCDIRLDWQSYIAEKEDDQILDLLVMIGNPFPLLDEDENEIESEDDVTVPLIKVKLNPHQGKQSSIPFTMEPKQMTVPAKSYAMATCKLTPMQNNKTTTTVQGYSLGFMSLANKNKFHRDGKSLRCDGIDVAPFHLNITGSIKPARLIVEPESDHGFVFKTMASSLLQQNSDSTYSIVEESFSARRFVITNNSGTTLQFYIDVKEPFLLICNEDGAPKTPKGTSENQFCLKQRSNIEVKIGLKLTPSLLSSYVKAIRGVVGNDADLSCSKSHLSNIEIEDALDLIFPNGTKQVYELKAIVHLPMLQLASEVLDFGKCLAGQDREFHVVLRNIGKSDCQWKAEIDKDYPETSRSVFRISPDFGYLHGDVQHGSKNSETIKVIFNAKQNAEYECRVIFSGILGEAPIRLRLVGMGSYDQLSEQIVNIIT